MKRSAVWLLVWMFVGSSAFAAWQVDTDDATESIETWTAERLQTQRDLVADGAGEATDDERARALVAWDEALASFASIGPLQAAAASYKRAREEAPQRLEAQRAELAALAQLLQVDATATATVPQVEAELQVAQVSASSARQALADVEAEVTRRTARRAEIPALLAAARATAVSGTVQSELSSTETSPLVRAAEAAARDVEIMRAQAAAAALDAEVASYEARGGLLAARLEVAERAVVVAEELVTALDSRLMERRRDAAERAAAEAQEARRAMVDADPVVQQLVADNLALTERRQQLTRQSEAAATATHITRGEYEELIERRQRVTEKVEIVGFTEPMALLLRSDRSTLPAVATLEQQIDARSVTSAQVRIESIDVQNELRALRRSPDALIDRLLADADVAPDLLDEVRAQLSAALVARDGHLEALREELDTLFWRLLDLDVYQHQLVNAAVDYRAYIDGHVLWLADAGPIGLDSFAEVGDAVGALVEPERWTGLIDGTVGAVREAGWRAWGVVALVLMALLARARMRRHVMTTAEEVASRKNPSFRPTAKALLIAVINALVGPLILYTFGYFLSAGSVDSSFAVPIGSAAKLVAILAYGLVLVRRVSLRSGLGDVYLRWPQPGRRSVRRHAWTVAMFALPLYGLSMVLEADNTAVLSRVSLIASMVMLGVSTFSLFRPSGQLMKPQLAAARRNVVSQFHGAWFPIAVIAPFAVAVASYAGFAYAASEFALRLFATWSLVATVFIVDSVIHRWVFIEQRRMRREQARRRRDALVAAAEVARSADVPVADIGVDDVSVEELDVAQLDQQTRRLLQLVTGLVIAVGLYAIWSSLFPALQAAQRVELWSVPVETTVVGDDGVTQTALDIKRIMLSDLLFVVSLFALILLALRNLPGVLELLVLRRLPLEAGTGYAITALIRYTLVIGGMMLIFPPLGLTWDRTQWLVAAVSVGLGFGLQEIFANFVSGLILLAERPIRVGDIVTVGATEGVVTKIRARATTIRDWNRRELLVPNRDFITGQLINWTLTDPVTRVVFPIGVAYGSDPKLVTETLLELARSDTLAMTDPAPTVVFRQFGDSSLNFELRVFLSNRDLWPRLVHGINSEITAAFERKGIEIPFPQRDVHVRTYGRGESPVGELTAS